MIFYVFFFFSIAQLVERAATSSDIINKTFPANFKFGVSTSAYQIEGGWDADGKGESIWDRYVHTSPYIFGHETGDIACDSYHKYLEDIAMVKNLGVNHYRFSLSWSRILPTGFVNEVNQAGVNYYKTLIDLLNKNGIEPYVTLYHWDLPQRLQDIGGWPNPLLADYFADYARLAFTLFGDGVKNWMTFNEPKQTCNMGYGGVFQPPGYNSNGIGNYLCAYTVLKAHAKAYHIYDEEFRSKQNGRVTIVADTIWYEPASDSQKDREAAERKIQFDFGLYANPIFNGNYPQVMIDRIGNRSVMEGFSKSRLPELSPQEINYIKGTHDFFAFNSYRSTLVKWIEDAEIGVPSFEADCSVNTFDNQSWNGVTPWGMRNLINWIDRTYNHPEIVITENGYYDDGRLDDPDRINYYAEYLSQILLAIFEDGVNVTGYTAWSLMDNFEWNTAYTRKFGLYHVDFDSTNRTRTIKKSGDYYKKVIKTKCLVDSCED